MEDAVTNSVEQSCPWGTGDHSSCQEIAHLWNLKVSLGNTECCYRFRPGVPMNL